MKSTLCFLAAMLCLTQGVLSALLAQPELKRIGQPETKQLELDYVASALPAYLRVQRDLSRQILAAPSLAAPAYKQVFEPLRRLKRAAAAYDRVQGQSDAYIVPAAYIVGGAYAY